MSELNKIALKILLNGKGILAADESTGTMTKRLEGVKVPSSSKNRLLFRETLFSSEGMKSCIGGVILYDETIKQISNSKKSIPELISNSGAVPGIKVDTGAKKLALSNNETITEGLDGLRDRLKEYYDLGARFTKWRGVFKIATKNNLPSIESIKANAHALGRYSALVQEANMVPIVEPEVLMDGDHDIKTCYQVTKIVLEETFYQLSNSNVKLDGIILKPNMVLNGADSGIKNETNQVSEMTLGCLKENVPKGVPGIAFLSGGQTEFEATKNLNEINKMNDSEFIMTYSYGRALQQSALKFWSKDIKDIQGTQKIFNHRANMCSLAAQGKWSAELETK
jgi:fructose-bisphosphate aldolase, class I